MADGKSLCRLPQHSKALVSYFFGKEVLCRLQEIDRRKRTLPYTFVEADGSASVVAPRLRGPERPVYQPRDQVFWYTTLLDIELYNFLLTKIGVHEIYYNASGDTTCSSG